MKNKKIYLLILLFFVCILSIQVISATQDTAKEDIISADNNKDNNLETNICYNDVSTSKENSKINLEENNNDKEDSSRTDKTTTINGESLTFTELNTTINGNNNSTLYLSNNYTYDNGSDNNFINGIPISRDLTIYGNGVTLDGSNMARIFYVSNSTLNVKFYNINFINGNSTYGGAIYRGNAYNCTFTGNTASEDGGAIYEGNAYNCTFTQNIADEGGAIYNGNAYNCTFTQNTADWRGGAISYGNATHCNFTQNYAKSYGGAIYMGYATYCNFTQNNANNGGAIHYGNAYNCNFTQNHANHDGGAISESNATNCIFNQNNAPQWGGAMAYCNATNCTFTENNANNGGAMAYCNATNCTFTENNATQRGGALYYCNATNCTFTNNYDEQDDAMFYGKAIVCRFNEDSYDNTRIIRSYIVVSDYRTSYGSGERFIFNLIANDILEDVKLDGFNTSIKIYKHGYIKTVYGLSGEGWLVDLSPGEYSVLLNLTGDYDVPDNTATITVLKGDTNVVINPIVDKVVGETIPITFDTKSNGTATIKVNGEIVPDGNFTPTKEGTYNVTVEIAENDYYNAGSSEITFTVEKTNTTVTIIPIVDYVVGETIPITFLTNSNGTATILVNGETVENATFTPTKAGSYNVTVKIAENDYFTNATNQTTFTVEKTDTTVMISPIIDYVVGETIPITFLTNSNGTATILVNGQIIPEGKFTPTTSGTYNLTVEIAENDYYTSGSNQTTFTVEKLTSKITTNPVSTTYNIGKYLVITLKDANDKPINDAALTVNLDTLKNYKTDANGQVKINVGSLTPKTYTAKITYAGSDSIEGTTASVKVTVKKATPKITAKAAKYKLKVKTKKYTSTFKNNKNQAIKNTKVTLKLGGKTYNVKTNNKGQAIFKITNLKKIGSYIGVISFPTNQYYNKVTKKVKIIVKK